MGIPISLLYSGQLLQTVSFVYDYRYNYHYQVAPYAVQYFPFSFDQVGKYVRCTHIAHAHSWCVTIFSSLCSSSTLGVPAVSILSMISVSMME